MTEPKRKPYNTGLRDPETVSGSHNRVLKAVFTNLQRYSLHDGPGLRTILFLKGCPLSCLWCSNPETQNFQPELLYSPNMCIGCGSCLQACGYGAVSVQGKKMAFDKGKCTVCGDCVDACPTAAVSVAGKLIGVDEAVEALEADAVFFRRSGGGVTISGGEPSQHPDFTAEVLKKLRKRGIHTAVETCGYAEVRRLFRTVEYADLVLYDLKIADPEGHKKATGADNAVILENAKKISAEKEIIFRIPVIPGYTDSKENLTAIARLVTGIKRQPEVHLLPYHAFGTGKYQGIGKEYKLPEVEPPSEEKMQECKRIFEDKKIAVKLL